MIPGSVRGVTALPCMREAALWQPQVVCIVSTKLALGFILSSFAPFPNNEEYVHVRRRFSGIFGDGKAADQLLGQEAALIPCLQTT